MLPKMRKEKYFRKSSINPERRKKQEKQESMKRRKVQKRSPNTEKEEK